ncbi:MAG TPA: DEAD/DEAH box helicase [Byssovorax sp.]
MEPVTSPMSEWEQSEARRVLLGDAYNSFGDLPAEWLVDAALAAAEGADFSVAEAALDALERRFAFGERDGLVVVERPARGAVLGTYRTGRTDAEGSPRSRARAGQRPYETRIDALDPPRGSCDCPDYLRSSLGICKHLFAVIASIVDPSAAPHRAPRIAAPPPALTWDPRIAPTGPIDRLEGLRLAPPAGGDVSASVARLFQRGRIPAARRTSGAKRLETLRALLRACADGFDASPAARAIVGEELERCEARASVAAKMPSLLAALGSLERTLYPYQREGVERFLRDGRLLLADDMGLGKTTQAIAGCHALFHTGLAARGLVIAPASLKPQWLREWQSATDVPAAVVDGRPGARRRAYAGLERGFLIINYEQLLRDADDIRRLAPDVVVLDEAQRIKNYATKSAVYVKALTPRFRLALTGTPMENRLEELASLLDWIDDVALAPKWRLVPFYTELRGDGGRGAAGARHLDTLRERLAPCMIRRLRKDVLGQLPARTDTRVPVEMTAQQRDEHDALTPLIAGITARARRRPLRQAEFLKLMSLLTQQRIISNGLGQLRFDEVWPALSGARPEPALLDGLFAPKLGELRRIVADLVVTQQRKIVVFSQWRRMLRLAAWSIGDLLGDELRAVFFTGAERPTQRTRSVVDFHDDPRVRVMFLTDAGGVGLNLQRAASACVNLELPWNPAVVEQRIARIHRIGQSQPIDVYNLVTETGIEARLAALLGTKQALFSGLFDGTSAEIRFEEAASFLERVEKLVEPDVAAAPPPLDAESRDAVDVLELDAVERAPEPSEAAVADEGAQPTESQHVTSAAPRDLDTFTALLGSIRVERAAGGQVRIEAPEEAIAPLLAALAKVSELLAAATRPA